MGLVLLSLFFIIVLWCNIYKMFIDFVNLTSYFWHFMPQKDQLTCLLRKPFKPAILFSTGSRINTPHVAVTFVGWRVYTQVFLGIPGNTLWCPWTKGTAVNEWVHSFVDFCLIPYPRPVPLTFQPQICKDGFISIVFDVSPECCLFDRGCGPIIGRCFGACNGTSCAEERRPQ